MCGLGAAVVLVRAYCSPALSAIRARRIQNPPCVPLMLAVQSMAWHTYFSSVYKQVLVQGMMVCMSGTAYAPANTWLHVLIAGFTHPVFQCRVQTASTVVTRTD
jgi:hypothetical protein